MTREDIAGVTPEQWARVIEMIRQRTSFQPHELAIAAHISRPTALAIMARLATVGAARLYFLVYHAAEETPFAKRPYAQGLPQPQLPQHCQVCDEEIEQSADLKYDVLIELEPGQVALE